MAVTEEMLLLDEWERESKECHLRKNELCSIWSIKTKCTPENCVSLDSETSQKIAQELKRQLSC
jgi:hypothetical protein